MIKITNNLKVDSKCIKDFRPNTLLVITQSGSKELYVNDIVMIVGILNNLAVIYNFSQSKSVAASSSDMSKYMACEYKGEITLRNK